MKTMIAVVGIVLVTGCSSTRLAEECEIRLADIATADACRADRDCSARGFVFPSIEEDRDYAARHCAPRG